MQTCELDEETLAGISFTGATLAPFFNHDPKLASAQLEPTAQAICDLDAQAAGQAWHFVGDALAQECLQGMQLGLAGGLQAPELYDEYRRLFVGPQAKVAPPWGSVYTDSDMVVFGESTIALKEWLRHQGISVARNQSDEPEDHIGTMLGLMAWIAQYKPEALCDFLQHHLLTWAGHFLAIVEEQSQHVFYRSLAKLTAATLGGIQAQLNLEVDQPKFYR